MLGRFRIDYCCGGAEDLRQAARQANVSMELLSTALNEAIMSADEIGLNRDWTLAGAGELVDHLVSHHHAFLRRELPRVEELLSRVILAHEHRHGGILRAIQRQFELLRSDILVHLAREEEVLFPLIRQMELFAQGLSEQPQGHGGTVRSPIRQMEFEHDNVGRWLRHIRELTEDFSLPAGACPSFAALYSALHALEADLHEHIHLENNILFPKAVLIEQSVTAK